MQKTLATAVLCVTALMLAQAQGAGRVRAQQNENWSAPIQISQTTDKSWFPDVIADKSGRVHVVWAGHEDGYDTVYYRSLFPNGSWTNQTDVFAESVAERRLQEATRPSLALDGAGNLLLTNRVLDIYFSKVFAAQAEIAKAWSDPRKISTKDTGYFSRMVVDRNDVIHAFITQNVPTPDCDICMHLFYSRSKDGGFTWSGPQDISVASNGVVKPQVVLDSQDHLHVIWEAGVSGGTLGQVMPPTSVYYAASRDGGNAWSDPVPLGIGLQDEQYRSPTLGVDGQDRLVAVWLKTPEDRVFYQISQDNGVNWSQPLAIPGLYGAYGVRDNRLDTYHMAADGAGQLHLVTVGRVAADQQQLGVYHTLWNGQYWSQPQVVHPPSADVPMWPRVAVSLGNQLHVVYTLNTTANMGLNEGDNGVRLDIFYSQSTLQLPGAAAAVAPVPYPTATPAPTATPEVLSNASQPTAPALANKTPGNVDYQNLRTEVDDYGMLLVSGLPVVLIFIAGYFLIRRRRT